MNRGTGLAALLGLGVLFLASRIGREGDSSTEENNGSEGYNSTEENDAPVSDTGTIDARLAGLLGVPYIWGDGSPAGYAVGLDCSGLVQVAAVALGLLSSSAPDRTAQQIADYCEHVSGAVKAGDVACYGKSWSNVTHVAVAASSGDADAPVLSASGGGRSTTTPTEGAEVKLFSSQNYRSDFLGWVSWP